MPAPWLPFISSSLVVTFIMTPNSCASMTNAKPLLLDQAACALPLHVVGSGGAGEREGSRFPAETLSKRPVRLSFSLSAE